MTNETIQDLRNNIRVGFTEKRGRAWWANPEHKDDGSHFEGPVPETVARDLIGWEPLEGPVQTTFLSADGVTTVTDPTKKMYVNPRTMTSVGVTGTRHRAHNYAETLIDVPEILADGKLGIGSVGTLNKGGRAFVQYELPENIDAGKNVKFRPFLTAATSLDGSLATTFLRGFQVVVCDNTLAMALGERGRSEYRVRHTTNSRVNVHDARTALGLIEQAADAFQAEVQALVNEYVSDEKWKKFLDELVPVPDKEGHSKTIAENKRRELDRLWKFDDRVAPWANSAWGVLAATNTYMNHIATVRNTSRDERRVSKLIDGSIAKADQHALAVLALV